MPGSQEKAGDGRWRGKLERGYRAGSGSQARLEGQQDSQEGWSGRGEGQSSKPESQEQRAGRGQEAVEQQR